MNTEKIKEFVNNSELSQLQKNVMVGFIDRTNQEEQKKREDRKLIEQVACEKKLSEIMLSTDEVKIYTVYGKDEWEIKYPFRSIFLSKMGVWERNVVVAPSFDVALLIYLERKYLGDNSQFAKFASKMLEIKSI